MKHDARASAEVKNIKTVFSGSDQAVILPRQARDKLFPGKMLTCIVLFRRAPASLP